MAVTYSDSLTTDLSRVRFSIGDVTSGAGPKPADGNFTDAEITGLITIEGTWQRAVAACFETLASLWAKQVTFASGEQSASLSHVAQQFRESAASWRSRFGATGSTSSGSSPVIRADGYSDDLDNVTA